MRNLAVLLLLSGTAMSATAGAQTPPATDTGARPGNVIGTGQSLPRSDKAGNITAGDTHSVLAPNLPAPAGVESVHDLLADAKADLAAKHTGAAQEALERAETRALDRSVPAGTESVPDNGPMISAIAQARDALAAGNLKGAIAIIDKAKQS